MNLEDAEKLIKELTGAEPYLSNCDTIPYLFEMISVLNERIKVLEDSHNMCAKCGCEYCECGEYGS